MGAVGHAAARVGESENRESEVCLGRHLYWRRAEERGDTLVESEHVGPAPLSGGPLRSRLIERGRSVRTHLRVRALAAAPMPEAAKRIYAFDFDDTIVHTDARIRTYHGPMSTAQYAVVPAAGAVLRADAFAEFAWWRRCSLRPARYFDVFMEALDARAPVLVISSRDHSQKDFRALLRRTAALGGRCLHANVYGMCVNHKRARERYGRDTSAPERKVRALKDMLTRFPRSWPVGFSDDDAKNLAAMRKGFRRGRRRRGRAITLFHARTGRRERL